MLVTGGDNGREKRKRPEAEEVAWSDRGEKVFYYRKDVGTTVDSTWDAMLQVILRGERCNIRSLAVDLGWVPERGGHESQFGRQSVLMDVLGKWWEEDMGQSVKSSERDRRSYFLYIDPDTVQQIKTVVQATFRPDEVLEDTEVKARLVEAGVLPWCGDQRQVAMVDRSLACIAWWKRKWTTLDHCMDVEVFFFFFFFFFIFFFFFFFFFVLYTCIVTHLGTVCGTFTRFALCVYRACWPVLAETFRDNPPAATMIECGLIDPKYRIEIEVTALAP